MTTFSYFYEDAEKEWMRREGDDGSVFAFGAVPTNPMYAEFLSSGATAEAYVAPPEPAPLTAEQKLEQFGLTLTELKELLGL